MAGPLDGRAAIVTGGARGLGLGVAQRLAAEGARVILWDRDFSSFDAAAAGFAPLARDVVDVSSRAGVEAAFALAVERSGGVDILVNNAGINGPVLPVVDYPEDEWRRVLAVNLDSVFYCCRAAVRHMKPRGFGRIVNIASMAGKDGVPNIAAYSAAKGGVIAFTKALAKELATDGVTVNAVAPAMAETDLMKQMTPEHIAAMKAKIPMGRFLQIPEVGALVAFMVGPDCSFTTGFTFDLSGGRTTY